MTARSAGRVWLQPAVLHVVHAGQLAEHGGLAGVRDANGLVSTSVRAEQLAHYGSPDAADLDAAYAYGIARNHPFIDGNKRTAFVAMELFLACNGFELAASDADCVLTKLRVATDDLPEAEFAAWIRSRMRAA